MSGLGTVDRSVRENALSEAIRFHSDNSSSLGLSVKDDEIVDTAAKFEKFVKEGTSDAGTE